MAHNSNLAGQVIAIFRGFLNDMGYSQSNGAAPANGAGNARRSPSGLILRLRRAGKMKPGGTEVPPEKPIFNAGISQLLPGQNPWQVCGP